MVPPIVQEALQELVDHTFKRVLTRDRVPDDVGVPIGHPGPKAAAVLRLIHWICSIYLWILSDIGH